VSALNLDWSEPGDPPKSVRAKPLAKPVTYAPLTREREVELVRRYREDGDLDARDELVGAHRPMVVAMAQPMWRGNRTPLDTLIEYGMFGLRIAAEPLRPSLTKKGKMVGFDPTKGSRFSTYARHKALQWMRDALADDPGPVLKEEESTKAAEAAEDGDWRTAPSLRGIFHDTPAVVLILQRRDSYRQPNHPWDLWHPPRWAADQYKRKVRWRNFRKHPRTSTELANLKAYRWRVGRILKTYEAAAKRDGT
jgi:hypothetical protein